MRRLLAFLVILLLVGAAAVPGGHEAFNYWFDGTKWVETSATNPFPVSGIFSASLSGFTPGNTSATLTATAASSASTALPAGATVALQNVGTEAVSCVFASGAATATASKIIIQPGSTKYLSTTGFDHAACIDQATSGSNLVVLVGGSGLGTDSGGGSAGGGSGGAVTVADGSDVTQGAIADAAYSGSGSGTVVSIQKYVGAKIEAVRALLAGTLTIGGTVTANLGTLNGTATAANQSTEIASLATIATNSAAPLPAQVNTTSVINIGNVGQTNGDPCSTQAHVYTTINVATSGTTVLVGGVSSKKKYLCSIMLKNNAANNVAVFAGHGSTCGTSAVAIMGGTSTGAGFILAANDGFIAGSGTNAIAATTVNADDVCIALSASSQVSGYVVTADQ